MRNSGKPCSCFPVGWLDIKPWGFQVSNTFASVLNSHRKKINYRKAISTDFANSLHRKFLLRQKKSNATVLKYLYFIKLSLTLIFFFQKVR